MPGFNLISRLKEFLKQELVYSSFYSAIATFIRIGTAFLMSKIVAIYVGPRGLGLMGQLSNFVTVTLVFAGGGFSNGIVKYIAQYRINERENLKKLISTCFSICIGCGLLVGSILFLFAIQFSNLILGDTQYSSIFQIFGCTVVFYSLNTLFLSLANGHKDYKLYNFINGLGSIIGLGISYILIRLMGVMGALAATVVNQSVIFVFNFYFIRKAIWFQRSYFQLQVQKREFRSLIKYLLMAIVSSVCTPITQMIIRKYVSNHFSLEEAGIWEAINRISSLYLMFFTTSLITYYLPKLSEIVIVSELKEEIKRVYKIIMPIVIVCSLTIFLSRSLIIKILFTSDFMQAEPLFGFQMIGDVIKITSWLLSILLVAKGKYSIYIISEILFNASFVVFSIWAMKIGGFKMITLGYAINYMLYGLYIFFITRKYILKNS